MMSNQTQSQSQYRTVKEVISLIQLGIETPRDAFTLSNKRITDDNYLINRKNERDARIKERKALIKSFTSFLKEYDYKGNPERFEKMFGATVDDMFTKLVMLKVMIEVCTIELKHRHYVVLDDTNIE